MIELSPRQTVVLALASDGKSDKEIARLLGLGVDSVKEHIFRARMKLGARNRTAAVASAVRARLIA